MAVLSLLCSLFFIISLLVSLVWSQQLSTDPSYYYNLCAPSTCNNLSIRYPFTPSTPCHLWPRITSCVNNKTFLISNPGVSNVHRILSINYTDPATITLVSVANELFTCPSHISKPTYRAKGTSFTLLSNYTIGTHFNCTAPIPSNSGIKGLQNASCIGCEGQDPSNVCYYAPGLFLTAPSCETSDLYTQGESFDPSGVGNLRAYLQLGFELKYSKPVDCLECEETGGRCGANPLSGSFICFCPSSVHYRNCSDGIVDDISTWADKYGRKPSKPSKLIVAVVSATVATLMLAVIILLLVILTRRRQYKFNFNKETISNISLTRYSYSQLKKFTTNFSSKLGEGGFGSVYKGIIFQGGSEVPIAVKMLKNSSQTKKQFMNEVTTIGSIHHQNLVGMLGYCFQGDTHALVYEFVENGSLDNYIYDNRKENEVEDRKRLSYNRLYTIGLETAKGILYLHNGCNQKILHCDIKPSNILLDSSFSVKLADFGLARMINKDHSHVTISRAQGTPGYSAPEMWLKTYGPVTDKSDVYSYGMLLLEMVGRRKNYDARGSDSSQVYYPEWIYNQIEKIGFPSKTTESGGDDAFEIDLDGESIYEEDDNFFRKMCLVGLWCIQHNPVNRPAMSKIVQMLEGHVEIDMPPHPFKQRPGDFHGRTDS